MRSTILTISAAVGLASAHFGLEYPAWRADTLAENTTYDQWQYPCAGVPYGVGEKTEWPLEGGSVSLDLHHPWSYVYINLGLGENTTNFNISLTPQLLNVTGKGTFCVPALPFDVPVADGQNGTIQVVTNGQSGSALYNCADIVFRSSAKPLSDDKCANANNATAVVVGEATATDPSSTPEPTPNAAHALAVGGIAQAAIFGVIGSMVFGIVA